MAPKSLARAGMGARAVMRRLGPELLTWPGLLLITLVVLGSVLPGLVAVVRDQDGFTLKYLVTYFTQPPHLQVMGTTLGVALVVSVLCVVLVLPACVFVSIRGGVVAKLFTGCVVASFWVSILVRTFAWEVLLARYGPIATAIGALFGEQAIPQMLYTRGAVVAAMVQVMVPYATLLILPATRQVDHDVVHAARVLGASPWRTFWTAYWPQVSQSVLAAWLATFVVSLSFFVTPALLGGPGDTFVAMLMEAEVHSFNVSMAATDALMLMLTMALAAGLVVRFTRLPFNRLVGGATSR